MAKIHSATEDLQIKDTVKCHLTHLTPVRMVITKSSSEIVEKRERERRERMSECVTGA